MASPRDLVESADGFRASLLYVANWHFIAESTDYFAPQDPSPVLHFWSLAVEEQFYVAWPLLLAGTWAVAGRWGRTRGRQRAIAAAIVALLASASVASMVVLRADSATRAYFGTDTRAYQLLAGACLALVPQVLARARQSRAARVLGPLGAAGVIVIASAGFDRGPFTRSAAATVATLALLVGVESRPRDVVGRALSIRPATYLGSISYATYLWHWPVILVIREVGLQMSAAALAIVAAVVATALAALSNELLELPIRRTPVLDRHRFLVIGAGLTSSVLAAFVLLPPLLDPDRASSLPSAAAPPAARPGTPPDVRLTPVPHGYSFEEVHDERFGVDLAVECTDGPATDCTIVDGNGPQLLLIGDSNAVMYLPALTELARRSDLRLSSAAMAGCPWQLGLESPHPDLAARCAEVRQDTYDRLLPELQPDVVILVNHRDANGLGASPGGLFGPALQEASDASLDRLVASGAQIVYVAPAPSGSMRLDPLSCLARSDYVEDCAFTAAEGASWLVDRIVARSAGEPALHVLDLGPVICARLPVCDAMVGEVPTYFDGFHITTRYSIELADDIGRELWQLGVMGAASPPPDA